MEYSTKMSSEIRDDNFVRFVGWKETNESIRKYYSLKNVRIISNKLTELLEGVADRPIVVPDSTICNVMSSIYYNYRAPTKDIYGRYNIPNTPENLIQSMIDQVIEVIYTDVRNNMEMEQYNSTLNIWDATLMGNFNRKGLRQHAPIRIREKTPSFMGKVSFMTY